MRTHVALGMDIISKAAWLECAHDVVACHHERFDGSGYPGALEADAIPLNARIFAVADVFDAMTSRRCYKDAVPLEEARAFMRGGSGSYFDPRVLAAFDALAPRSTARFGMATMGGCGGTLRALVARHFQESDAEGAPA